MDNESQWVFLAGVEISGIEDKSLYLVAILVCDPEIRDRVRLQAFELCVDLISREQYFFAFTWILLVEHAARPASRCGYECTSTRKNGKVGNIGVRASEVDWLEVGGSILRY